MEIKIDLSGFKKDLDNIMQNYAKEHGINWEDSSSNKSEKKEEK